jgi:hypothetical protein
MVLFAFARLVGAKERVGSRTIGVLLGAPLKDKALAGSPGRYDTSTQLTAKHGNEPINDLRGGSCPERVVHAPLGRTRRVPLKIEWIRTARTTNRAGASQLAREQRRDRWRGNNEGRDGWHKQSRLRRGNPRRTVIESSRCCCFRLAQAERVILTLRILPSPALITRGDGTCHTPLPITPARGTISELNDRLSPRVGLPAAIPEQQNHYRPIQARGESR